MRIGLVTACYHPVINGVTRMVSLYGRNLRALGHEVTIFTLGRAGANEDEPQVIRSPAMPFVEGYHLSWRYSRQAQTCLQQMDIVHCHHPVMGLDLAARYSRCPIVYTNHTRYDLYGDAHLPFPPWLVRRLIGQLWPRLAALADVVVTPSANMREMLRAFGVRNRIEVIAQALAVAAELGKAKYITLGTDTLRLENLLTSIKGATIMA